jgi:hypothetical protein
VPPKRRFLQEPHGVTTQKTPLLIVTAVKTSNLTTKYMLVSRDQNAGQNRDIKIGNRSFENVSQFKYLGTTVTSRVKRESQEIAVTLLFLGRLD